MKVSNFYNKNQFVITGQEEIIFQSYDSTIARINLKSGELTLGYYWDYSKTTSKHLYLFINDYMIYLNYDIQKELKNNSFNDTTNKRKVINKLIDSKIIYYDENLK